MKQLAYNTLKHLIKLSLYLYYGKIRVSGLENVAKDKPVLFLPNHQNALMDVLLIAVDCNRKPYFLTRSDVFKGKFLHAFFGFLQMIAIYRIRDGRDALQNNQAVFDTCADLLLKKQAILLFPEANHNAKRRVRQLSKGFTRILDTALEKKTDLKIDLVPVGINYRDSTAFPDQVALFFGKPITVGPMASEMHGWSMEIRGKVTSALQQLTTHIGDEAHYQTIVAHLEALQVNFLDPASVNTQIAGIDLQKPTVSPTKKRRPGPLFFKAVFKVFNLPVAAIWKYMVKPKIWEPEFTATLRFGVALIAFPIYYSLVFTTCALALGFPFGLFCTLLLIFFNWIFVKTM